MALILAAVLGGTVLLWGGVLGMARLVDRLERRHLFLLGAWATLAAGAATGLVLFANHEEQRQHRQELRQQMDDFARRLQDLSERLVGQLEEKADLTASEFEIRSRLQNEQKSHERTRAELASRSQEYGRLEQVIAGEREAGRTYQTEVNRRLEERWTREDGRYQALQQTVAAQGQTLQQQSATLREELGRLTNAVAALQRSQEETANRLANWRQSQEQATQRLEGMERTLAGVQAGLDHARSRVDSLYSWRKK